MTDPKQQAVAKAAQDLILAYIEAHPELVEAAQTTKVLRGRGPSFWFGNERGRYVARDEAGAEILVLDLTSWVGSAEPRSRSAGR
jgi:hypothetical protein